MLRILILISSLLFVSSCALFEDRQGPAMSTEPHDQVYYATYEEVWRATNLVLQPYPLRVSNMDQGLLETDTIRGYRVFAPVYKVTQPPGVYRLTVRVVKGSLEKRTAVKVSISKDVTLQSDFFSDPKLLPSDGLEEKTLLYRIRREINIERALAKAQKKQNQQGQNSSAPPPQTK